MESERQIRKSGSISYKRRIVLCILLLYYLSGHVMFGQVKFNSALPDRKIKSLLEVTVRDKQSGLPLAGSHVVILSVKDTLKQTTDKNGRTVFQHSFAKDSISVDISFLGYKSFAGKFYCPHGHNVLDVPLIEDPMEIDAIVVRDNHVAMISRGDTVVYNPAAFKIMKGDPLRELLKRMPGLEMRDGGLYSSGRKVQKILINNTMLFGNNVSAAMDMIYGDEVVEVKSYDEIPQDLLTDADSLTRKERVLDIKTKTPREIAARITASASGGAFLAQEAEAIANLDLGIMRFKLDDPDIYADVVAGKNMSYDRPSSSPVSSVNGRFSIADHKKKKYTYTHRLNAGYNISEAESSSKMTWYPTDNFAERVSEFSSESEDRVMNFNYSGEHSFRLAGKTAMFLVTSAYYKGQGSDNRKRELLLTDSQNQQTDILNKQVNGTLWTDLKLLVRHSFKKTRRSASAEVRYVGMFSNGNGILKDTLNASVLPQYRTGLMKGATNSVMFSLSYNEPLAKNLSLDFRYDMGTTISDKRDIYTDRLTQTTDILNSSDFHQKEQRSTFGAGLSYRDNDKIRFYAGIRAMGMWQNNKEQIPETYDFPVNYWHFSPYVNFELTSSVRLSFNYTERANVPTSRQLRRHLDTTNPLFLVAGNPDLNLPVARKAKIEFNATSFPISTAWKLISEYEFIINSIANRIFYFPEPVYLEDYDYTTLLGATLLMPVNVPLSERLNTSFSADISSSALKSSFRPYIGHAYTRDPFYDADRLIRNIRHDFKAGMAYLSSFSDVFSLSASTGAVFSAIYHDGHNTYDQINAYAGVSPRWNIYKWLYWDGEFKYDYTKILGTDSKVENVVLDMAVSAQFGPGNRYYIGLKAGDILNRLRSHNFYFNDQYLQETHDRIFGRSIILTFRYVFDPSRK